MSALGMQSGVIKDDDLTASSSFEIGNVGPQNARWEPFLNNNARYTIFLTPRLHAKRVQRGIFFFIIQRRLFWGYTIRVIICWLLDVTKCLWWQFLLRILSAKWLFSLFYERFGAVFMLYIMGIHCKLWVYGVFGEFFFENRRHLPIRNCFHSSINPSASDGIAIGDKNNFAPSCRYVHFTYPILLLSSF